jgi:hypothetical protein
MSVGGIGRGGGKGRAGGVKGSAGKAPAGKTETAAFGGGVERTASLVGPSGQVGSSNVQGAQAAAPITAQALAIARQLKNGQFKSKDEATRKLVAEVLKEKLRMKSEALSSRITDALLDDPRLNQALERLWSKAE